MPKLIKISKEGMKEYIPYLMNELGYDNKEELLKDDENIENTFQMNYHGKPAGFINCEKHYYIRDFDVLTSFRRKGIGSMMLKEIEKKARKEGYDAITLHVAANNKIAINCYKKNGFKIEGKNETNHKGRICSKYLMEKKLHKYL